jgi:hypothetical protein
MVMVRLFLTNKNRDHVQELLIVVLARLFWTKKEQRLGTRVVVFGSGQAV